MKATPLEPGRAWLDDHGAAALLLAHGDPDGLSAGALIQRHLGGGAQASFQDPFTASATQFAPGRPLAIIDQGVRPVAGDGPRLYVDHHAAPETVDGVVVWDAKAGSTSLLAWRMLGEPAADTWLAGLGLVGDLGERGLRSSDIAAGPVAPLRRLATLCSAAGRLRDNPLPQAFALLADAAGADEALADPRTADLEAARTEVEALRREAARTPPQVGPAAALIEFDIPARVHSQVASSWARRLSPRPVVVANRGWRPGRVSFVVRCGERHDLRAWLGAIFIPPAEEAGDYGRGHPTATGGNLDVEVYERFAEVVRTTTQAPW